MTTRGTYPDGVAEPYALAAWGLRFQLLRAGSRYGLYAATRRQPGWELVAPCWHAWMRWLRGVAEAIEAAPGDDGVPERLGPKAMLLTGEKLIHDLDSGEAGKPSTSALADVSHDWLELLEEIEAESREVERYGVWPMAETRAHAAGMDLLGALEDSLTLMVFGDEADQAACAGTVEIYGLLRGTRADLQWSSMDPTPEFVLPESPERLVAEPGDLRDLVADFCEQLAETVKFTRGLQSTGMKLTEQQRVVVERHLVDGALRMRALAGADLGSIPRSEGQPATDLRSVLAGMRRYQRSLVLAISSNAKRRRQAFSGADLAGSLSRKSDA